MQETDQTDELAFEEIESEKADAASSPSVFEINTYPADFTLEVLNQKNRNGDIKIPKFQRRYVWKQPQASRLIDSFILGLPVPQIFLYTDEDEHLLVIDGQQRLRTISYYFEGYFGEPGPDGKRTVFRLQGLNENSSWTDKTFEELEESNKRKLRNAVLRAVIVKQLDPKDDTSVYHIFERLNTGGTQLTGQEIRNCVYLGRLNDLLVDLNTLKEWRKIVGKPNPDSRQKDVELILRYMALFHWGSKYKRPMKDFLSIFMRRNRSPTETLVSQETKRFTETCDTVLNALGPRPFNPRGALNAAVFDCVFATFARHLGAIPSDIATRYRGLLVDEEFDEVTRAHTTDEDAIRTRFDLAERTLFS